jgi:hypothetical protein
MPKNASKTVLFLVIPRFQLVSARPGSQLTLRTGDEKIPVHKSGGN